ncbi:hypothetical protein LJC32_01190 [Oscillospiraceae bacterium OttesenSCG-928-F05]|nr:hypothetical protein [Oscillospiraceae bacterium OttesenSCG-928-F05]
MLSQFSDPGIRSLAEYIETLETYTDCEAWGRSESINDGGRMTEQGYVTRDERSISKHYHGIVAAIPDEYKLNPYPIRPPCREKRTAPGQPGGGFFRPKNKPAREHGER